MVVIDNDLWADIHNCLCRLSLYEDEHERYDVGDEVMKILTRLDTARMQPLQGPLLNPTSTPSHTE